MKLSCASTSFFHTAEIPALMSYPIAASSASGVPVWLVCHELCSKKPQSFAYHMHSELHLRTSPMSKVLRDLPEYAFRQADLMALVLLHPVQLTVLTPINEIDRWQMRSIAAACEALDSRDSGRHALRIPPSDVWQHANRMQAFQIRECYTATRSVRGTPRFTDAMGNWQMISLLQHGCPVGIGSEPFLSHVPLSEEVDLKNVTDILSAWGMEGENLDAHRCACISALPQIGVLARAGHLLHLILPQDLTHHVLLMHTPNTFPKRHRRTRQPSGLQPCDASSSSPQVESRVSIFRSWADDLIRLMAGSPEFDGAAQAREVKALKEFAMWLETALYQQQRVFDLAAPGRGRDGFQYTPSSVLKCLLFSAELKDASRMRHALCFAVDMLAGHAEAALIKRSLLEAEIPAKSTMSRFRFYMDVAHMLRTAQTVRSERECVRFFMCDSSPQHGFNLLMSRCVTLRRNDIQAVTRAMNQLVALHSIPASEITSEEQQEMVPLSNILVENFCTHMCPPVALSAGQKQSDLAKQLSALSHQIWIEVGSFKFVLNSVVAFTGDLGTKAGFADSPNNDLYNLLPSQYERSFDIEDEQDCAPNRQDQRRTAHCFEHALFFPGLMHIIGNMTKDMVEALPNFERWYAGMHPLSVFLHRKDRLETIQSKFFHEGPLKTKYAWLFHSKCPSLAEWRWQTLITVLNYLLPRIFPLKLVWDPKHFSGEKKDAEINLAEITKAIRDPWFWSYGMMLCHVQTVLEDVCSWIGSCPCHPRQEGESADMLRRRRRAVNNYPDGADCPCVGMWAPMICAGELHDRVYEGFDQTQAKDLLQDTQSLPSADRASVFADWHLARAHVQVQLSVKLHFATVIPTLCCGIMHPDEHIARAVAAQCVQQYDQNPDPAAHHRLSVRMLGASGTRYWINEFLEGNSRDDLGDAFWKTVAPLKFINVNERPVEAYHALLKSRGGRKLNKTLNYLSIKFRLPDIREALQDQASAFSDYVALIHKLRHEFQRNLESPWPCAAPSGDGGGEGEHARTAPVCLPLRLG